MGDVSVSWPILLNSAGFLAVVGLLMRTESRISRLEAIVDMLKRG